jgi:hypothetical protein
MSFTLSHKSNTGVQTFDVHVDEDLKSINVTFYQKKTTLLLDTTNLHSTMVKEALKMINVWSTLTFLKEAQSQFFYKIYSNFAREDSAIKRMIQIVFDSENPTVCSLVVREADTCKNLDKDENIRFTIDLNFSQLSMLLKYILILVDSPQTQEKPTSTTESSEGDQLKHEINECNTHNLA